VNISSPFGPGSYAPTGFRLNTPGASRDSGTGFNSPAVSLADARERIRAAASGLAEAFRAFRTETRPVYTKSIISAAPSPAALSGLGARLTAVYGRSSVLETTVKVNTQISTGRSSSTTLGLDVTSAETASTLTSSATLGLNVNSTSSTIISTGEMNTGTTSYGSSTLSFAGSGLSSTSQGTLTGTYTGVNSAEAASALTLKITSNSTLNSFLATSAKFEVRDQANTLLFSYNGNLKAGDQVYLGADIGLTVSFSSGSLTQNHTASTTVSHAAVEVDANATFNNANTNLRPKFDNGAQVTAGSFTINGTSITINASDTINTVLSRINASGAGVTATLAGDKITLSTNAASESNIVLAGDTSGFLAATKLLAASTVRGNIRDDQQALSATTQFGGVVNGAFTVNGVSISVSRSTDTLASIIGRINSSNAGVTASYDSSLDKVILTGNSNSEDLITVGSDTSGFLAAAGLATNNTIRGNIRDDEQIFTKTSQFASITSGSFDLNGISISVDAGQDTLQTLIDRINDADAGVTAAYNSSTDKLVFTPNVSGAALSLQGDTSGFLAEAHVAEGTAGTHVNADAAFNGTGVNDPLFDSGVTVGAGSFTVNGVTINVAASDSIRTVLSRITASNAGVTATYDDTTQTVMLTTNEESTTAITIGNDTSGFLAAVKLDGTAESTAGVISIDPFDSVLSAMTEYAGVQPGTITLNGQQIVIDPETITIRDLVSALNSLADVSAAFSETTGELRLISDVSGGAISLSDTSGLLAALRIPSGVHQGSAGITDTVETQTGTTTISNSSEVAARISEAVEKLNEALRDVLKVRDDIPGRLAVEATFQRAIASLGDSGIEGLNFDSAAVRISLDREKLGGSLTRTLGNEADVESALEKILEHFSAETANLAPAATASTRLQPMAQIANIHAQVMASHFAATVNLLKAVEAYGGKKRASMADVGQGSRTI
jgi:hypothetical protein